ncbi:MAG: hypothetical protein HYU86_04925 [Chloroflexi bacterium]|nr:hypothetical protein [Chloroflexota bacterium]
MKRWALFLGVTLLALACAATKGPDPKDMVLGPEDIPPGFNMDEAGTGVLTNEKLAGDEGDTRELLRRLQSWGRRTGYGVTFVRDLDKASPATALSIQNLVSVYKDEEGAQKAFQYPSTNPKQEATSLPVPTIGHEAKAYRSTQKINDLEIAHILVEFRYGNLVSQVATISPAPFASVEEALGYARIVLGHMKGLPPEKGPREFALAAAQAK